MITIEKLNHLLQDTSVKDILNVLDIIKVNEQPHPFCVTGKHIKRYAIDTSAGPCGMRINPLTKEWSNKRETKKGIIDTCSLTFEQHTYELLVLFEIKEIDLQTLEDSLREETGDLKKIFVEYNIVGFNLVTKK